jgi:hypothetical protein
MFLVFTIVPPCNASPEFLKRSETSFDLSLFVGYDSLGLLCREPDRLAPDPCVPDSLQLASEQTADSARRSVDGGKQIGVCFLHRHTTKGQNFRANAALPLSRAACTYAYGDLAHPPAKPAKPKS